METATPRSNQCGLEAKDLSIFYYVLRIRTSNDGGYLDRHPQKKHRPYSYTS